MSRFSPANFSAAGADPNRRRQGGLPNDVEALKAMVIDLHGRAQAQDLHIQLQREGLRILARHVELMRKGAGDQHANLRIAGQQDEVMLIPQSNGRNGSG